jgi:hypothetical protein
LNLKLHKILLSIKDKNSLKLFFIMKYKYIITKIKKLINRMIPNIKINSNKHYSFLFINIFNISEYERITIYLIIMIIINIILLKLIIDIFSFLLGFILYHLKTFLWAGKYPFLIRFHLYYQKNDSIIPFIFRCMWAILILIILICHFLYLLLFK